MRGGESLLVLLLASLDSGDREGASGRRHS